MSCTRLTTSSFTWRCALRPTTRLRPRNQHRCCQHGRLTAEGSRDAHSVAITLGIETATLSQEEEEEEEDLIRIQ
jgi:hypothetical protein